jgi:hypothetical protein
MARSREFDDAIWKSIEKRRQEERKREQERKNSVQRAQSDIARRSLAVRAARVVELSAEQVRVNSREAIYRRINDRLQADATAMTDFLQRQRILPRDGFYGGSSREPEYRRRLFGRGTFDVGRPISISGWLLVSNRWDREDTNNTYYAGPGSDGSYMVNGGITGTYTVQRIYMSGIALSSAGKLT